MCRAATHPILALSCKIIMSTWLQANLPAAVTIGLAVWIVEDNRIVMTTMSADSKIGKVLLTGPSLSQSSRLEGYKQQQFRLFPKQALWARISLQESHYSLWEADAKKRVPLHSNCDSHRSCRHLKKGVLFFEPLFPFSFFACLALPHGKY